jgi:hypothetical protein
MTKNRGHTPPRRIQRWLKKLHHHEKAVRIEALERLLKLPEPQAIPALVAEVSRLHWTVQAEMAEVLGQHDDHRLVNEWLAILEDCSAPLLEEAIDILGALRVERAAIPLIRLMASWNLSRQRQAIQALGKIGNTTALQPLQHALHERRYHAVRQEIQEALDRIQTTIEDVAFGTLAWDHVTSTRLWVNPDVSTFTRPLSHLKFLHIHPASSSFHRVERFLTYAVQYLGQSYLQRHVVAKIYGEEEQLHLNLRNSLTNLCYDVILDSETCITPGEADGRMRECAE